VLPSQYRERIHQRFRNIPPGTIDYALIGCYVFLVGLFAGAQSVPAFHSIVANVFFKINDLVRGFFGG
jgi:hypothetical protein